MTCSLTTSSSRQLSMRIVVSGGAYLRGVVEEIEQHLLEQHRVELQHRQVGCELDLDLCAA